MPLPGIELMDPYKYRARIFAASDESPNLAKDIAILYLIKLSRFKEW
jgi:hypothetical protein